MTSQVRFEQRMCADGINQIAIATLDNPSSLNALTFEMLKQLHDLLLHWRDDPTIVCIVLEGEGEKAFCAGGDVRAMHDVMKNQSKTQIQAFCRDYFTLEYQCDYLIHTFPKPIVAWGQGIIMGGGMGLFMGASHKVVTSNSRLAMPEVSIGLFPDVGATWFLNQLDNGIGMFLGMTGTMVNASDAIEIRLADHLLLEDSRTTLIETLQIQYWPKESSGENSIQDEYKSIVSDVLSLVSEHAASEIEALKPSLQLMPFYRQIQSACSSQHVRDVWQNITEIDTEGVEETALKWMERAKLTLTTGSPITAHLCFRQMTNYTELPLADCFRLELGLAINCALLGEFQEGVRARLIDKDGEPQWLYPTVDSVDIDVIDDLFMSLWQPDLHPLAQLDQ
ncbi:enoyl-CoA hydratase/isomerase family protein [Vibrio amylolyticus]|uniref:enoyl-CoA hydratase/isomerase family protein n=1 Tax=Vibrio amylolyticus TaxID=2847292 RepID=UPI003550FE30